MRLVLALLLLASPAFAQAPASLDLKEGTLSYTLIHKLHEVKGTSKALEGRAVVTPAGAARVQVRAKVASFDSGNSNRDVHMREVTHEALHPYVSVKGTLDGVTLPLAAPVEKTLNATVELNGQKQMIPVPVKLEPAGSGLRATFKFPISLEAFQIERPELLFVKVDDKVVVDGDLKFEPAPR